MEGGLLEAHKFEFLPVQQKPPRGGASCLIHPSISMRQKTCPNSQPKKQQPRRQSGQWWATHLSLKKKRTSAPTLFPRTAMASTAPFSPSRGFLFFCFLLPLLLAPLQSSRGASQCPLDFSYMQTLRWDASACKANATGPLCCQVLLSLIGIPMSAYLNSSHQFELPNATAARDCVHDLIARLSFHDSSSSTAAIAEACFPDAETSLVASPRHCAGIVTLADWRRVMANSTANVDASCHADLYRDDGACSVCTATARSAVTYLVSRNGNGNATALNKCFNFVVLYVAGVANSLGPFSTGVQQCMFKIPLPHKRRHSAAAAAAAASGAATGFLVVSVAGFLLWRRRRGRRRRPWSYSRLFRRRAGTGAVWYSLEKLRAATCGFNKDNLVGAGGYGAVFRGSLPDGRPIAVKRVYAAAGQASVDELLNEARVVNGIRHRNLVQLLGLCVSGGEAEAETEIESEESQVSVYLVYDYFPNGSLDGHIFGPHPPLTWRQRCNVIADVARGLRYLHDGVRPAILHRDVKPTNVLLDHAMHARLTDFGLAKAALAGPSVQVSTGVAGTFGYVAPEYALYGHLSPRSDVYGFGVVALQVLSGRHALLSTSATSASAADRTIAEWAWRLVDGGRLAEVVDEKVRAEADVAEMERFVKVGLLCAHVDVKCRPSMADAMRMLDGELALPQGIPERPFPGSMSTDSFQLLSQLHSFSSRTSSSLL